MTIAESRKSGNRNTSTSIGLIGLDQNQTASLEIFILEMSKMWGR